MRKLLPVAVMASAIGVPYVASQWTDLKANVFGSGKATTGSFNPSSAYSTTPQLPAAKNSGQTTEKIFSRHLALVTGHFPNGRVTTRISK